MVALIVWAFALGFVLVLLGILGYGLFGQLSRLRRAVAEVEAQLTPALAALRPQAPPGRHRAG